jgi:hypothetical protein
MGLVLESIPSPYQHKYQAMRPYTSTSAFDIVLSYSGLANRRCGDIEIQHKLIFIGWWTLNAFALRPSRDRPPLFNFKCRWTLSAFAPRPSRRPTTIVQLQMQVDLERIRSSSRRPTTSFTFKCRWTLSAFASRPEDRPHLSPSNAGGP